MPSHFWVTIDGSLQVVHLKGENDRVKEKLRLAEKSAASTQLVMEKLYRQLDQLQKKN